MAGSLCVDHSTTFFSLIHVQTHTPMHANNHTNKNTHAYMRPHERTHTHIHSPSNIFFDKHDSLPAYRAGLQINATFLFCHFGLDDWI